MTRLRLIPVFGADFKSFEELQWVINSNVVGGLEWSRAGAGRVMRTLIAMTQAKQQNTYGNSSQDE